MTNCVYIKDSQTIRYTTSLVSSKIYRLFESKSRIQMVNDRHTGNLLMKWTSSESKGHTFYLICILLYYVINSEKRKGK